METFCKGAIFINYRLEDSTDLARDIGKAINDAFQGKRVAFWDEDNLRLTEAWPTKLKEALGQAEIMFSLIGPDWLASFDRKPSPQREIGDWVQYEIEYALAEGIDVIPVLNGGASLPEPQAAPDFFPRTLHPLLTRQALIIGKNQKKEGIQTLIKCLYELSLIRIPAAIQSYPSTHLPLLASLPLPEESLIRLKTRDEAGNLKIDKPFLGPTFFDEDHARIFYGREREIRRLFHTVRRHRLSYLDGYSGTGKSSLLHAGLLPRMKNLDVWAVFGPIRRNKLAGGIHKQLTAFLEKHQLPPNKKCLLILDQIEEIYTDPLNGPEIEPFGHLLDDLLCNNGHLHVLLAFRSEYLRKIQQFLDEYLINFYFEPGEVELQNMSREGIETAILQPGKEFPTRFKYKIDSELAQRIARDFTGNDFRPYGILLQIQLLELWDAATPAFARGERHFTPDLYSKNQQKDLHKYVHDKLSEISNRYRDSWGEKIDRGLGLDVLYRYTTADGTATSLPDKVFQEAYGHLDEIPYNDHLKCSELLLAFKQVYLLNEAGLKEKESRLAHDTLAPVIRKKYLDSDLPAQRAWRIIETRERELLQGFTDVSFSEGDIASIEAGRPYMQALPEKIETLLERDKQVFVQRRQTRFDYAYRSALESIEHLRYEEAMDQLRIAAHEGIAFDQLREAAWHLPYVWLELADTDQLSATLSLLKDLGENETWVAQLEGALSRSPEALRQLLQQERPDWYRAMDARYYPEMIALPGATFPMGSDEGIFKNESPVHRVKVRAFNLGATPVTCWQYGLFCLMTGAKLPLDSGFGRGERPVVNVSWYRALDYCNWLGQRKGMQPCYKGSGEQRTCDWEQKGYRLPTEAEWEYAAWLAGSGKRFATGEDAADPENMNFNPEHAYNLHEKVQHLFKAGSYRGGTTPVKEFGPSQGFYDLSGNVFEWCWDGFDEGYYGSRDDWEDPRGPDSSPANTKVLRGGSWFHPGYMCRVAYRYDALPDDENPYNGFRVVGYF